VLTLLSAPRAQELTAEGDRSALYDVARALTRLQAAFGGAPLLKGKGAAAAAVRALLARMRQELGPDGPIIGAHACMHAESPLLLRILATGRSCVKTRDRASMLLAGISSWAHA
jgi:hypothetical protein